MNLIESVYDISEKFMNDPKYVFIDYSELNKIAEIMKGEDPPIFPKPIGDEFKICLMELIGNSINYCYWYGSSSIRPNDACSTKMYDIVYASFKKYKEKHSSFSIENCLNDVARYISLERFPLIEQRIKHLFELKGNAEKFAKLVCDTKIELEFLLTTMVQVFPGYASDIFLKRAFLFFCQMNRIFGWFEDYMKTIPVPADYQVPKMLKYHKILFYSLELQKMIDDEILIPTGSRIECEIRSATIIACRKLVELTGWTTPQVDAYFWLRRKEDTSPFHLTITTDY